MKKDYAIPPGFPPWPAGNGGNGPACGENALWSPPGPGRENPEEMCIRDRDIHAGL